MHHGRNIYQYWQLLHTSHTHCYLRFMEYRLKVTPRHYPTPIPGTHHEVLPIVQSNYSYKLRSQLTLFVGHNRSGDIGSDISVFFSLGAAYCTGRGEVVEDVESPLPLSTPLLLVKPNLGLSTPQIFKALDLAGLSKLDPLALMEGIKKDGCSFDICVNDLEAPAFSELPELLELKNKLVEACSETVVFMSGSGSTIVVVGNDAVPKFVADDPDLFKAQTRLITRKKGEWFAPSTEY